MGLAPARPRPRTTVTGSPTTRRCRAPCSKWWTPTPARWWTTAKPAASASPPSPVSCSFPASSSATKGSGNARGPLPVGWGQRRTPVREIAGADDRRRLLGPATTRPVGLPVTPLPRESAVGRAPGPRRSSPAGPRYTPPHRDPRSRAALGPALPEPRNRVRRALPDRRTRRGSGPGGIGHGGARPPPGAPGAGGAPGDRDDGIAGDGAEGRAPLHGGGASLREGRQTPEEFVRAQSATTGLPESCAGRTWRRTGSCWNGWTKFSTPSPAVSTSTSSPPDTASRNAAFRSRTRRKLRCSAACFPRIPRASTPCGCRSFRCGSACC